MTSAKDLNSWTASIMERSGSNPLHLLTHLLDSWLHHRDTEPSRSTAISGLSIGSLFCYVIINVIRGTAINSLLQPYEGPHVNRWSIIEPLADLIVFKKGRSTAWTSGMANGIEQTCVA